MGEGLARSLRQGDRLAGGRITLGERESATSSAMLPGTERMRKTSQSAGEEYTSATSSVELLDVVDSMDATMLKVRETTRIYYKKVHGDEPDYTSYDAEHEFYFSKRSMSDWTLDRDVQLDPSGLLPLGEAVSYTQGKNESAPTVGDTAPSAGIKPASTDPPKVRDPGARTTVSLGSTGGAQLRSQSLPTSGTATALANYNYSAMATYLERYCGLSPCGAYNSNFRSFYGLGGDCTNFISQALQAGGWASVSGWYQNDNYWWYNSSNQTFSWAAVDHWASFALNSGRAYNLSNVWNLGVGDVLQPDRDGNGSKEHSMMVSYRSGTTPYFTYHSSNRYRRSLNLVLQDWASPKTIYYAWRT
jgi:Putative amidase domain